MEGRFVEVLKRAGVAEGVFEEGFPGDGFLVEGGRVVGFAGFAVLLVIELEAQFALEVGEGGLWVIGIADEGFAIFDLFAGGRICKAPGPFTEDASEFLDLPFILEVEGVVIVVVLGSGDELLESGSPVLGQGEILNKADILLGHEAGGGKKESAQQGEAS